MFRVHASLHVGAGQFRAIMELHILAQHEGVAGAVLRDIPAMRKIGDDGFSAIARVAADQVGEHVRLRANVRERARLVDAGMRLAGENRHFQHAAALRVWFGGFELEPAAVILVGHALCQAPRRAHSIACRHRHRRGTFPAGSRTDHRHAARLDYPYCYVFPFGL